MKISADPLQFARKPPAGLRAALVYGPNRALVTEVVAAMRQSLLPGGSDDFSFVTIQPEDLKSNPARLADELSSFGFFATKKILYVKDIGDGMVKAVTEALDMPDAGHFLILEGDELGPKSALRAWAEKSDSAASLACYMLEGAALNRFIVEQFQRQNAAIAPDAVHMIMHRLGNDMTALPLLARQLCDYVGGAKPVITLAHVDAVLVDQAEHELDVSTSAIADGDAAAFDRALYAMYEGKSMVAVLRAAQNYFYKLRSVQVDIKNGTGQEDALKKLRPPLFFKAKPHFIRHLRNWPLQRIDRALSELLYLESMCKKTGTPEIALIQQRLYPLMLSKAA